MVIYLACTYKNVLKKTLLSEMKRFFMRGKWMRKKAHKHIQSAENILNEKLYYFQALSFESDRSN